MERLRHVHYFGANSLKCLCGVLSMVSVFQNASEKISGRIEWSDNPLMELLLQSDDMISTISDSSLRILHWQTFADITHRAPNASR